MKKTGFILTAFVIILELLPYGAVLIFAPSPAETIKETYSYFSLTPVGYANVAPFVTAILTCILLILELTEKVTGNVHVRKMLWPVSFAAVIISLAPVLLGLHYCTITGGIITVVLTAKCILLK